MANLSVIKPFENCVAARTNMLKITDTFEKILSKLMVGDEGIGGVVYSCKEFNRNKRETSEDYYRRVDLEVKNAIRAKLGLKSSEPVKYDRLIKSQTVMFFFIADYDCSSEQLQKDARSYGFDLDKVIQTILSLRLKLAFINDAASHYEIAPTFYNSELYIGALENRVFKDGNSCIEALRVNLYFTKQHEIALSLHKKVFNCSHEDIFIAEGKDTSMFFQQKSKTLKVKESLDAVRFSKRPYMAYSLPEKYQDDPNYVNKGYDNSTNYHLTVTLNKLIMTLFNSCIGFEPIQFKADFIVDTFIESNDEYDNELVIIDSFSSYDTDEWRTKYRKHLKEVFGASCVIGVEEAPKPDQLQIKSVNYLVVNEEQKKNGSSILRKDTGALLNGFFKALELHKNINNKVDFDYYTSVKIHRFLQKIPSVTQGVNIGSVTKKIIPKDNNGNKLPSITVLKELDKNRIKKIKTELWLKERVFQHNLVDGLSLPRSELVLFYVRKTSGKNKQAYISVVNVTTGVKGIEITNQVRYDKNDASRFNYSYQYLKSAFPESNRSCFESMYNQGFYIYDKNHQKLLVSYSNDRVPKIIGNAAFDNIERNKKPNGINRERPPQKCVLPYYINPTTNKQLHHVFLEDCGQDGVRYFVSKSGQPNSTIDKQNLTKNILVFNADDSTAFPLKEEVTSLFLQSFTFDILNNNEVSKKSILQKISELYIEN